MIQFVAGAAAGYVFGTRAGRKRYAQLKSAYQHAVNSPVAKAAVASTRKALANKLDPQPRMREVKDLRSRGKLRLKDETKPDTTSPIIYEPDDE